MAGGYLEDHPSIELVSKPPCISHLAHLEGAYPYLGDLYMNVSENSGIPNLHPKCWSFLVSETTHDCWGKPPFWETAILVLHRGEHEGNTIRIYKYFDNHFTYNMIYIILYNIC